MNKSNKDIEFREARKIWDGRRRFIDKLRKFGKCPVSNTRPRSIFGQARDHDIYDCVRCRRLESLEKDEPIGRCLICDQIVKAKATGITIKFLGEWITVRPILCSSKECEEAFHRSTLTIVNCSLCGEEHYKERDPKKWVNPSENLCPKCDSMYPVRREMNRLTDSLRRAERQDLDATLMLPEWMSILDAFDWHCAYCGGPFECIEHITPISRGGGTTKGNCVPSCSSCNSKKGNRLIAKQPELKEGILYNPLFSKRLQEINSRH